jgi:hypothetical protein
MKRNRKTKTRKNEKAHELPKNRSSGKTENQKIRKTKKETKT